MYTLWIVAQAAPPNGNLIVTMLPLILIFFIFWMLVHRPQQKEMKKQQEFLNKLKVGDDIVTSGGLFGKIVSVEDTILTIEISRGNRVRVARVKVNPVQSVLPQAVVATKDEAVLDTDEKPEKKDKKSKKNDSAEGGDA